MRRAPLTQRDLEGAGCDMPGRAHTSHEGLFFHGRCHPSSPTQVEYRDGVLRITCALCKSIVADVRVARH